MAYPSNRRCPSCGYTLSWCETCGEEGCGSGGCPERDTHFPEARVLDEDVAAQLHREGGDAQ